MREDAHRRGGVETLVDVLVHEGDHVGDLVGAAGDAGEDLRLAIAAMGEKRSYIVLRIAGELVARAADGRAVGGVVDGVIARREFFQAAHIGAHVAIRRADHRGGPAHDVIAREEGVFLLQREAHVVGGVAGGEDAFEGPALPRDEIAVAHHDIGDELHVAGFLDLHRGGFGAVRAVWAKAVGDGAGLRLQRRRQR